MAWVNNDGPTGLFTRVNGSSVRRTVMASCIMLMVTFMRATGLTTKQTVKEHIHMLMERSMLGSGKMINSTVLV